MTPPLSHNVLPDLTTRQPEDESRTFSQLRTSLIKVLRNSPESREPICDALELIESLQQNRDTKQNPDAPFPRAARPPRNDSAQDYIIQSTTDGAFLTERRPSGSQPFRCPKDAYDAAARILSESSQAQHFEDLLERLNNATGQHHADYRLRVCLRFWLSHKIIERFRTRYRAVAPDKFLQQAADLWQNSN